MNVEPRSLPTVRTRIVPLQEVWQSTAVVLLRNGHSLVELTALLAAAADKVIAEQEVG